MVQPLKSVMTLSTNLAQINHGTANDCCRELKVIDDAACGDYRSIHGATFINIIPNEVGFGWYNCVPKRSARKHCYEAIPRKAKACR